LDNTQTTFIKPKSSYYIILNARTFNNNPQENTVPPWLLPCTCDNQRCYCNAQLKPDILCVIGHPYQRHPPLLSQDTINKKFKITNHSLMTSLLKDGHSSPCHHSWSPWNNPHSLNKTLSDTFTIPKTSLQMTFKEINTIAIHHTRSILLRKRKLENNEPLPT
jgi:hypothetical protein